VTWSTVCHPPALAEVGNYLAFCCPISQHSTFLYITYIGSDNDSKRTTFVIIILGSHHPWSSSSTVRIIHCFFHPMWSSLDHCPSCRET